MSTNLWSSWRLLCRSSTPWFWTCKTMPSSTKFLFRPPHQPQLRWQRSNNRQNIQLMQSKTRAERWRINIWLSMISTDTSTLRCVNLKFLAKAVLLIPHFTFRIRNQLFTMESSMAIPDQMQHLTPTLISTTTLPSIPNTPQTSRRPCVKPSSSLTFPSWRKPKLRTWIQVSSSLVTSSSSIEIFLLGTTALCAMYRKTEKKLYIGWCGDSQALIARVGNVRQVQK